jgi:predicted RNA-binding protein associated with RNAse of E/G family
VTQPRRVAIHYRRPPADLRIYDQRVVREQKDVLVTISEPLVLKEPLTVHGDVALEQDSLAVWFTFPGVWHDIGRFHRADGRFTGIYANILTPPVIDGAIWHTTDLWLDVWQSDQGAAVLLDQDEFEAGVAAGHVDERTAARAWEEATAIMDLVQDERWPPPIVQEWTLERALRALAI